MHIVHASRLLVFLLIGLLTLVPSALAQQDLEWEYLVVSYGSTYFRNPIADLADGQAGFSKVQLFSELGVTIPDEATNLQRNIDVLGRFGWEMVSIVGTIGGDQQIVFKRPYDERRSAEEAERIREEREALIADYNATRTEGQAEDSSDDRPSLVDVDAVEFAQATEDRNEFDANKVRVLVERAAAWGFPLPELTTSGNAYGPDSDPRVEVTITQDVTEAALIAPGQYRQSLVNDAVDQFFEALARSGLSEPEYGCGIGESESGTADMTITAVINHDGVTSTVGTFRETYCFSPNL